MPFCDHAAFDAHPPTSITTTISFTLTSLRSWWSDVHQYGSVHTKVFSNCIKQLKLKLKAARLDY